MVQLDKDHVATHVLDAHLVALVCARMLCCQHALVAKRGQLVQIAQHECLEGLAVGCVHEGFECVVGVLGHGGRGCLRHGK